MGTLLQDLKYAIRMLAKAPGFTIVAVLTLALGIGATTAIFSVIDATLLARLPYRQSDRLVMVWESNPTRGLDRNVVSPGNFLHWQEENTVFDDLAGFYDLRLNLTGGGEPEQIPVQAVTPNLFSLLGVNANIGRTFISEEGQPGKDNVVLLSYGLWQRKFAGDPNIPGKTITLDGKTQTIVGVMPRGFELFVQQHSALCLATFSRKFWASGRKRRRQDWPRASRLRLRSRACSEACCSKSSQPTRRYLPQSPPCSWSSLLRRATFQRGGPRAWTRSWRCDTNEPPLTLIHKSPQARVLAFSLPFGSVILV